MTDTLDAKRLATWAEIDEVTQMAIRVSLAMPERIGAIVPSNISRNVRTSLGYVVHSSFVTPLAMELIEAADFNSTPPALPRAKRARAKAAA